MGVPKKTKKKPKNIDELINAKPFEDEDEKHINILIRIPVEWIDPSSPILWVDSSVRQLAERAIYQAIIDQSMDRVKIPKIKIDRKKLEEQILKEIASRKADEILDNGY